MTETLDTAIFNALTYARRKHPVFPRDASSAGARIVEEALELIQALNNLSGDAPSGATSLAATRREALQLIATTIRLLEETMPYYEEQLNREIATAKAYEVARTSGEQLVRRPRSLSSLVWEQKNRKERGK